MKVAAKALPIRPIQVIHPTLPIRAIRPILPLLIVLRLRRAVITTTVAATGIGVPPLKK